MTPPPLPASLPAPAHALVPVPAASPGGGVAPYSDGVRALGAVSPTPVAPTPVVQQQAAPGGAAAAAGTPKAAPRTQPAAEDDPLMLDAAEVSIPRTPAVMVYHSAVPCRMMHP